MNGSLENCSFDVMVSIEDDWVGGVAAMVLDSVLKKRWA
jgi:hypothetical protein